MYPGGNSESVLWFLIGLLFVLGIIAVLIYVIAWFNRWMDRRAEAKKDQADQDTT